jgi:hypothetical protein
MRLQRAQQSETELGLDRWSIFSNLGFVLNLAPAMAALIATAAFSLLADHAQIAGNAEILKTVLRFLRITLVLCLPLSVLLPLYRLIIDRKKETFLRVKQMSSTVDPLKHWLLRPFQGIGIAFLFRAKLLTMLQFVGGPVSFLGHDGIADGRQFVLLSSAIACASLLLSTVWTMDDMGIRHFNPRDQELKMVGKYVGTLMPIVFGTYGVMGLMSDYSLSGALLLVLKGVLVLYPPFACFAVLHAHFIRVRKGFVAQAAKLERGEIWQNR